MPITKKNAITSSWDLVSSTEGPTANWGYRPLLGLSKCLKVRKWPSRFKTQICLSFLKHIAIFHKEDPGPKQYISNGNQLSS